MKTKLESGMNFFINENTYILENDSFYNNISTPPYSTKDVDFIFKKANNLLLVEAKSTTHPTDLDDIATKFIDSLQIYIAVILDKVFTKSTTISNKMKQIDNLKLDIKIILITKKIPEKYINSTKEELHKKLQKFIRIFAISSVSVMNEKQARSRHFIQ